MTPIVLIFLTSGLFLGWSLGANDAANVFGTAVGSRMVRFTTAAVICAVFVVLGSVISGAGAAHGLGKLGAVNALAGSFTVALAAAFTVRSMTKLGLPVSTTQAIVGAIVGWNLFSGSVTDVSALVRIVGTWIACPILGAVFAVILYRVTVLVIRVVKPHLLHLDLWTRIGLVLAGAFGAYSLGANNIANVMGVFVESSPFGELKIYGPLGLSSTQQLFLVGAIAIGIGVFYSRRVMQTVGDGILPVSPVAAWVAVVAHSLVLFIFSSVWLQQLVLRAGLPRIPLIPVSSSQAVVGAVIGIGLSRGLRSARQINWGVLAGIGAGWVWTPIMAAVICFFMLFIVQNVFQQKVFEPQTYELTDAALARIEQAGIETGALRELRHREMPSAAAFRRAVRAAAGLRGQSLAVVTEAAEVHRTVFDDERLAALHGGGLTAEQIAAVQGLAGRWFDHRWQIADALAARSAAWRPDPNPQIAHREALEGRLDYIEMFFTADQERSRNAPDD